MHNASCNHHHHLKENFLYQLSNWDLHRSFFFDLLFALGLYFFVCVYCCGCCITFYCFLFFGIWLASLDFIVNIFNGPTIFFCQINNKVDDDDEDYNFFFSFDFFLAMWISPKSHTHWWWQKSYLVLWYRQYSKYKGEKTFHQKNPGKESEKEKKENEYETKQTNKRKWMKKMGIIQQTHRKNEFRWFASFFEILDSCIHVWCSYSKIVSMEYHSSIPSVRMWKPLLCVCFVLFFFC